MGDHATSEGVTGVWLCTATTGVAHMLIWGISVVAWAGLGTALPGVVWAAGVALAGLVDLGSPAAGGTARGFRRSLAASWPLLAAAACLGAGMVWLATQLPIQGFDLAFFSIAAGLCVGGLCADRLDRRRGVVVVRRDARAGGRGLVVLARVSATS
jgi:hypothetical protein